MIKCRICGEFISYDWNLSDICASCKHKSDWIEAQYAVMGWPEVADVGARPLEEMNKKE